MFFESNAYTAEFHSGWLLITENASAEVYPVQLLDTKTGRNITRRQFVEAVKGFGLDKACQTFRKLAAN